MNITCMTCLVGDKDLLTKTVYCPLSKESKRANDFCTEWVGRDDYGRVIRVSVVEEQ